MRAQIVSAAASHESPLAPEVIAFAAHQCAELAGVRLVGMEEIAAREFEHRLLRQPEEVCRSAVHGHDPAVTGEDDGRGGRRLEHGPEPFLALSQQGDRRERAVSEHERGDQRGEEQRVRLEEERDGDAEAREHVVDPEAERAEEAALGTECP